MSSPAASPPGTVIAAALLLGVGGALLFLSGLTGLHLLYALYALPYIGLAWAVYRRKRWAYRLVIVLCVIGIALGVVRLTGSLAGGLNTMAWPVIYLALLLTPSARAWFR